MTILIMISLPFDTIPAVICEFSEQLGDQITHLSVGSE